MALKVKAREKLIKFSKTDEGVWRYVMQPELYSALTQEKVIREAAEAGEVIKAWATEGHSVALPGLGTMRFGLSAKTVADVNDVKTGLIKTRRIIFTPAVELKNELANTSVVITCYDRNGNEVKRVTSADSGEVEDPEGENTNTGDNTGENTGDNGGGNGGNDNGGNGTLIDDEDGD